MIEQICRRLDKTIEQGVIDYDFVELIYKVIDHPGEYPKNFVDMILDVHNEVDAFRASYIVNHSEYNIELNEPISIPEWLTDGLKETRQKYIEYWNQRVEK